jgi:hypothetical protein
MKPHWEPSHRAAGNGLTTTLFKLGEMELTYTASADSPVNGSLRRGFFFVNVPLGFAQGGNNGDEQNPGGAIAVHFRHWPIGGRWYHVAMTWDLDGDRANGDSKIELFIDGYPKVRYARMNARELGRDARLSGTALDPKPIEFGSREDASEHMAYGTTLDDVRVYRNELCYAAPPQPADPCVTPFFQATFDDPNTPLRATLNDGSGQIDLAVLQTLP